MKKLIFFIILFSILVIALPVKADLQEPNLLEVKYPAFPHIAPPSQTTTLPNYIKYIYHFAIGAVGFAALVILIIAGLQYLTSTGNAEKIKDAKNRISSALLGLLILFCSWIILNTINPQLIHFQAPGDLIIPPNLTPGVYICKERVDIVGFAQERRNLEGVSGATATNNQKQEVYRLGEILKTVWEKCFLIEAGGNLNKEIEGKAKFAYLVPGHEIHSSSYQLYGAILYENRSFAGKGKVIYKHSSGENATEWPISDTKTASIRPFLLNFNPDPSWQVTQYKLVHYNDWGEEREESKTCKPGGASSATNTCPTISEIHSVKIEGDLFIVFFKESGGAWNMNTEIDVYVKDDSDLRDNLMAVWKKDQCVERREPTWRDRYYPCASRAVVVSADFY